MKEGSTMKHVVKYAAVIMVTCSLLQMSAQDSLVKKDPCDNPLTTVAMKACAWEKFKRADSELNIVYKRLYGRLADDKHREILVKIQKEWIKFRDMSANFEAYFFEGGSAKEQVRVYALARITQERTRELERILKDQFDH